MFPGVGLPHLDGAEKRRAPSVAFKEPARSASLATHVSQSAAARLLQPRAKGQGLGKGRSLRQARRRFNELVKQPSLQGTPYGKVAKQLMVDTDENGPVQLGYICPHAWLYFACLQCHTYAQFSKGCLSQGLPGQEALAGSICMDSDDVQPGNVLHPGKGRSFLAMYWGVKEVPDFFRSRGLWRMTLMFVPTSLVK